MAGENEFTRRMNDILRRLAALGTSEESAKIVYPYDETQIPVGGYDAVHPSGDLDVSIEKERNINAGVPLYGEDTPRIPSEEWLDDPGHDRKHIPTGILTAAPRPIENREFETPASEERLPDVSSRGPLNIPETDLSVREVETLPDPSVPLDLSAGRPLAESFKTNALADVVANEGTPTGIYILEDENSGLHMGIGVDISALTDDYLEDLGVPKHIIDELRPAFGVKIGKDFRTGSRRLGRIRDQIDITQDQIDSISDLVMQRNWNNFVDELGPEKIREMHSLNADLPSILFGHYYRGSFGAGEKRSPKTFRHVMDGDYNSAAAEIIMADEFVHRPTGKFNRKTYENTPGVINRYKELSDAFRIAAGSEPYPLALWENMADFDIGYRVGGPIRDVYHRRLI